MRRIIIRIASVRCCWPARPVRWATLINWAQYPHLLCPRSRGKERLLCNPGHALCQIHPKQFSLEHVRNNFADRVHHYYYHSLNRSNMIWSNLRWSVEHLVESDLSSVGFVEDGSRSQQVALWAFSCVLCVWMFGWDWMCDRWVNSVLIFIRQIVFTKVSGGWLWMGLVLKSLLAWAWLCGLFLHRFPMRLIYSSGERIRALTRTIGLTHVGIRESTRFNGRWQMNSSVILATVFVVWLGLDEQQEFGYGNAEIGLDWRLILSVCQWAPFGCCCVQSFRVNREDVWKTIFVRIGYDECKQWEDVLISRTNVRVWNNVQWICLPIPCQQQ